MDELRFMVRTAEDLNEEYRRRLWAESMIPELEQMREGLAHFTQLGLGVPKSDKNAPHSGKDSDPPQ